MHKNSAISRFRHRRLRINERLEDWQRYIKRPCELFYKLKSVRESRVIMRRAEVLHALGLARECGAKPQSVSWSKYLDIRRYIPINLRRLYSLGLHKCNGLSILDIGAGAGFFLYLCQLHGHNVLGLDAMEDEYYRRMHSTFGVHCLPQMILPGVPLPDFDRKFDLVVAFAVCFHQTAQGLWSESDWRFFLTDLLQRHIVPGGRIYLLLNDAPPGDRADVLRKIAASFPNIYYGYQSVTILK
ncbi:MAG: class I SAM-dependent methyltransferase [Desulfovibrio sp.]|jgi:SAM-dependent methyltransferase|nr:class I SAM-dependent methyltransferase [Desulfovibrio sp.]